MRIYIVKIGQKLVLGTAAVLSSVLVAQSAMAGSINLSGQTVLRTGCGAATVACFVVLSAPVGPAACTSALVSFDASTSPGKNALATALTIKAAGFTANLTIDDTLCNGPNPKLIAITAN